MKKEMFPQIIKFVFTGVVNTAIDLVVLNILLALFGVTQLKYSFFKTVAFLLALTNSYFFNKYWVFGKRKSKKSLAKERISFVSLSVLSLVMNSLVSSLIFMVASRGYFNFSPIVAANIGAVVGILTVFIFNFISYKFVVFA